MPTGCQGWGRAGLTREHQLKGSASLLLTPRGKVPKHGSRTLMSQHLNRTSTFHTCGRREGTDSLPAHLASVCPASRTRRGPRTQGGETPGGKNSVQQGGHRHPSRIPSLCASRVSLSAGLLQMPEGLQILIKREEE